MAGSNSGAWNTTWKYVVIFLVLTVVVAAAGVGRILWVRRRNQRIQSEEQRATARIDHLSGAKNTEVSEGDLFGIRALEAGFTGGIAQPKPQLRAEVTPMSPGHSQISFIMDSPPRRPDNKRTQSPIAQPPSALKLQPVPKRRQESPEPSRPSTRNSSRPGTPSMWFNSQQDATVPNSWYLPTSEQIFGNGSGIRTRSASPRPSIALSRRSSIGSAKSVDTWGSASTRGRSRLEPSEAELTGRINHKGRSRSRLANEILASPMIGSDGTTDRLSSEYTEQSINESLTSPQSTLKPLPVAMSLFPNTDGQRVESPGSYTALEPNPNIVTSDYDDQVQNRKSPFLEQPQSNIRPLSIQEERFSFVPPTADDDRPAPHAITTRANESRASTYRPEKTHSYSDSGSRDYRRPSLTIIPTNSIHAHSRDSSARSEYSSTSEYSEYSTASTIKDHHSSRAPAPLTISIEPLSISPFEAFTFPPVAAPVSPPVNPPRNLTIHTNQSASHLAAPGIHSTHPSTSTVSSFNSLETTSVHDADYSDNESDSRKPSFELVSAQEARSPKEAPRLSFVRASGTWAGRKSGMMTPGLRSPIEDTFGEKRDEERR